MWMRIHTLNPGELVVADKPYLITTVLGSCVSITVFSSERQIGIINHALLPNAPHDCAISEIFRYVDTSFNYILKKAEKLGIATDSLDIKLFGGANMMQSGVDGAIKVGANNIKTAVSLINKKGLQLQAKDVGGRYGRKVMFNTLTGEVLVKKLK